MPPQSIRTSIACPGCGARLLACPDEGTYIGGCDACGGIWLDKLASRRLIAAELSPVARDFVRSISANAVDESADPYRSSAHHSARTCPVCDEPLQTVHLQVPKIAIDTCSTHGSYLDRGELQSIWSEAFEQAAAVHVRKQRRS